MPARRRHAGGLALHRARKPACSTTVASRSDVTAPVRTGRPRTAAGSSAPWSRRSSPATTTTRSPGCCCTPARPRAPGASRASPACSESTPAAAPRLPKPAARPRSAASLGFPTRPSTSSSKEVSHERGRHRRRSERGPQQDPARQLPAGGRCVGEDRAQALRLRRRPGRGDQARRRRGDGLRVQAGRGLQPGHRRPAQPDRRGARGPRGDRRRAGLRDRAGARGRLRARPRRDEEDADPEGPARQPPAGAGGQGDESGQAAKRRIPTPIGSACRTRSSRPPGPSSRCTSA